MDRLLRALADPTRREILHLLRQRDMAAGEIAARFSLTAASISHHLAVLREAELVTSERDGRTIIYSLNSTVVQDLLFTLFDEFGIGEEERP